MYGVRVPGMFGAVPMCNYIVMTSCHSFCALRIVDMIIQPSNCIVPFLVSSLCFVHTFSKGVSDFTAGCDIPVIRALR